MSASPPSSRFLTAKAAAAQLGISLSTLYAYVSRGLIRSEETGAKKRTRRYYAEDVAQLLQRKVHRANPEKAAERALHAGLPVLESGLTFIDEDKLYYRGLNAADLATSHSVENVAALLWTGDLNKPLDTLERPGSALPLRCHQVWPQLKDLPPLERVQSLLPLAAAADQSAYDLQTDAVCRTGGRILHLMTAALAGLAQKTSGLTQTLQRAWVAEHPQSQSLLGAALILCADHELNASTFAARVAASTGAHPYAVVAAGLAALSGHKHGGASTQAEALLLALEQGADPRQLLAQRLKNGQMLPGFGHLIYRGVDPRARTPLQPNHGLDPRSPRAAPESPVNRSSRPADRSAPQYRSSPSRAQPLPKPTFGNRCRPLCPRPHHRLDRPCHRTIPNPHPDPPQGTLQWAAAHYSLIHPSVLPPASP